METLDIAIDPGATWINIERLDLVFLEPMLDLGRDKFGTVVAAYMRWDAVARHRLPHRFQDLLRADLPFDSDRQTLTRTLIKQGQHFQRAALVGPIKDKVPSPHVIGIECLGR